MTTRAGEPQPATTPAMEDIVPGWDDDIISYEDIPISVHEEEDVQEGWDKSPAIPAIDGLIVQKGGKTLTFTEENGRFGMKVDYAIPVRARDADQGEDLEELLREIDPEVLRSRGGIPAVKTPPFLGPFSGQPDGSPPRQPDPDFDGIW